jgi:hypothetical protein
MSVETATIFSAPLTVRTRFGADTSGSSPRFVNGIELSTTANVTLTTPFGGFLTFTETGEEGGQAIGTLTLRITPQIHAALRDQDFRDRLIGTDIELDGIRRDWITTDLAQYVVGTDEMASDAELAAAGIGTPAANVDQFWENGRYLYLPVHALLGTVPTGRDLTMRCGSAGETPWFQDPAIPFGGQAWLNISDPDLFLVPDATINAQLFDVAGTDTLATVVASIIAPMAGTYEILIVPSGTHIINASFTAPQPRVLLYGAPRSATKPTLDVDVDLTITNPQELAFAGFSFDLQGGRLAFSGYGTDPNGNLPWSVRFTQCDFTRATAIVGGNRLLTVAVDRLLLLGNTFDNGTDTSNGGAFRLEHSYGSIVIGNDFGGSSAVRGGAFHVLDCSQLAFNANAFSGNSINPAGASADGYIDNRFASTSTPALTKFRNLIVTRSDTPVHCRFLYNATTDIEVEPGSIGVEIVSGNEVTTYVRVVLDRASNLNPGAYEQIPFTPSQILLFTRETAYISVFEVITATLNVRTSADSNVGDANLLGSLPASTFVVIDSNRTSQDDGTWVFQPVLLDPRWLPDFAENLFRFDEVPVDLWVAERPSLGGDALIQTVSNEYTSLPGYIGELTAEGGRHMIGADPGEYIVAVPEIAQWSELAVNADDAGSELTVHFEYGLMSDVAGFNTVPQAKRQLIDTALSLPASDVLVGEVIAGATGIAALKGRTVPNTSPARLDLTPAHLITGVLASAGLTPTWVASVPNTEPDYYLPDPNGGIAGDITLVNDVAQLQPGDVVLKGKYLIVDATTSADTGRISNVTTGRVTDAWLYVGAFSGTDMLGRTYAEATTDTPAHDMLTADSFDAADRTTTTVRALRSAQVVELTTPVWNDSLLGAVSDADIAALPVDVDTTSDTLDTDDVTTRLIAGTWLRHIRFNSVSGLNTAGIPTLLTLAVDATTTTRMNLVAQGGTASGAVSIRIEENPGTLAADVQGDFDLYAEAVSVHTTGNTASVIATTAEFDTTFDATGQLALSFDPAVRSPIRIRITINGQDFYTNEASLESDLHAILDDPEFLYTTLPRSDASWTGLKLPLAPAPAGLTSLGRMSDATSAYTNFQALTSTPNIIVSDGASYRRIGFGPTGSNDGLMEVGVTSIASFLADYSFATGTGISQEIIDILDVATSPEGELEGNNTYDDSFMSIGPGQWTGGQTTNRGELGGLLETFDTLCPDGFQELFGDFGIGYTQGVTQTQVRKAHLTINGITLNTTALKNQHLRQNLRNVNLIHSATDDSRFRLTMVYFLIDRMQNIFDLVLQQYASYSAVPDGYRGAPMLAYLLSYHIYRPSWIEATIQHDAANVADDDGVTEFHARLRQVNTLNPYATGALNASNRADADDRFTHLESGGLDTLPVAPFEDNIVTLLEEDLEKIRVELGQQGGVMEAAGVEFTVVSPPANSDRYGGFELQVGDDDASQTYGAVAQGTAGFTYVQTLQEDLLRLGYWVSNPTATQTADGDFGARTATALMLFQREWGINTPGTESQVVDAETLTALIGALNDPSWHRPGLLPENLAHDRCFQLQPSWDPDDPNAPYYVRYGEFEANEAGFPAENVFENNDCWATLDTLARLNEVVREWDARGYNIAGDRIAINDMSVIGFRDFPGRTNPNSHRTGQMIDIRSENSSMGDLRSANHSWDRTAEFILLAMAKGFNKNFTYCIYAYRQAAAASPGQRMVSPDAPHWHHVHIEKGNPMNGYPLDAAGNIDESQETSASNFCRNPDAADGLCAVHGTCPHFTTYP